MYRNLMKTLVAYLIPALLLTGCQSQQTASPTVPSLIHLPTSVTRVYAGKDFSITVRPTIEEIKTASKAEVSLANVVQGLMQEAPIDSVKTESPVARKNGNFVLSIPTTEDFKPGIWHVSSIRFFEPKTKKWTEYKEGLDFAGTPIQVVNDKKIATDKPAFEIYDVKQVVAK